MTHLQKCLKNSSRLCPGLIEIYHIEEKSQLKQLRKYLHIQIKWTSDFLLFKIFSCLTVNNEEEKKEEEKRPQFTVVPCI